MAKLPRYTYAIWPIDRIVEDPDDPPLDPAEVEQMKASILAVGRIHPIVVTTQGQVVAGRRRLAATKALGETHIDVAVPDFDDPRLLEALKGEENLVRNAPSAWATCEGLAMLHLYYVDAGERAEAGDYADDGVTTSALGARFRLQKRQTQRYLEVWHGLTPDARTAVAGSPHVNRMSQKDLLALAKLEPDTQLELALEAQRTPLNTVLKAHTPVTPPDPEALVRAALKAIAAVVEVKAPWAEVLALAEAIEAEGAPADAPAPPPEEPSAPERGSGDPAPAVSSPVVVETAPVGVPSAGVEAESTTSRMRATAETETAEREPAAAADRPERRPVESEPAGPESTMPGGRSGRRPVDAVRDALPDVAGALEAGQAALDRARRTGHRPASTTVTLESGMARVAAVVAPAFGVVVDGAEASGPADAVDVVRALADALAPRMRGRRALERLQTMVGGLPRPGGPPG